MTVREMNHCSIVRPFFWFWCVEKVMEKVGKGDGRIYLRRVRRSPAPNPPPATADSPLPMATCLSANPTPDHGRMTMV